MSERFVRSIHEGKTCPECGGCHFGSNHCAFSAEGKAEDAEALKRRVEKPLAPRTFTAEEVDRAIEAGVSAWQDADCQYPGCGCVSEHIKKALGDAK